MTDRTAKQVIVMRKDLNMRKGKMIAQGAHASLRVILQAGGANADRTTYSIAMTEPMAAWMTGRFMKIAVSVDSEAALDDRDQRFLGIDRHAHLREPSGQPRRQRRRERDRVRVLVAREPTIGEHLQRCVRALRDHLALAHAEVLAHHDHLLGHALFAHDATLRRPVGER